MVIKMTNHGGYRPGAGRKKMEVPRKPRTTTAFDYEWELIKKIMQQLKHGHFEEYQKFADSIADK